jgi:hypothetical protein
MHRLLVLYPPPSDPDHFRSYAAPRGESPYYCVFEADFDDAAAYSMAMESLEGQAVLADLPNYTTGGVVSLNYELRAD